MKLKTLKPCIPPGVPSLRCGLKGSDRIRLALRARPVPRSEDEQRGAAKGARVEAGGNPCALWVWKRSLLT